MKTTISTLLLSVFISLDVRAGLSELKLNGDKMEVDDGDILSLFITAAAQVVAVVCGFICVYGLVRLLWDGWAKIGEYREGKVSSVILALEPLLTNGAMVAVTFAVSVYLVTNFTGWMS